MSWGIFFEKDDDKIVALHHRLDVGHALTSGCDCKPAEDVSDFGDPIWTHRRFEWR